MIKKSLLGSILFCVVDILNRYLLGYTSMLFEKVLPQVQLLYADKVEETTLNLCVGVPTVPALTAGVYFVEFLPQKPSDEAWWSLCHNS